MSNPYDQSSAYLAKIFAVSSKNSAVVGIAELHNRSKVLFGCNLFMRNAGRFAKKCSRWDNSGKYLQNFSATTALMAIGASLFVAFSIIRFISPMFSYGAQPSLVAILSFIGLMMISGLSYAALFFVIPRMASGNRVIMITIIAGVFLRIVFFGSTPIYEDDWYRYLWDGAAVSTGVNPYIYTPADAALVDVFGAPAPLSDDEDLRRLQELGRQHPVSLERINYPYISTIYPPMAQFGFAAAHHIKPFSLDAWRCILLAADLAMIIILLAALKITGRNQLWGLLYWWNPLIIVTTFNAGHMDVLMTPFLLGSLFLVQKQRPFSAAVCLAAAASIKFWPLVLAPVMFRQWRTNPRILISIGVVLLAAAAILLAPMLLSIDWDRSGLAAYAQSWRRNAFLFPLFAGGFDLLTLDGDLWARLLVASIVSGTSIWFGLGATTGKNKLAASLLVVTGLLFFLSPTGYPWYAVWLVIFLPFSPSMGLALMAVTMPLYYARYYLEAHGHGVLFNFVLVPIEFLIPLGVLVLERARRLA